MTVPERRERRETCLWLSELASWHTGTVARLAATYGSFEAALDRPRRELAALVARSATGRTCNQDDAGGAGGAEDGETPCGPETAAWRAAMARQKPVLAAAVRPDGIVVAFTDRLYPDRLRALPDPPPALFVAAAGGAREACARLRRLAGMPAVAVVGTRSPSAYGLDMAAAIAADLAREGAIVVSGLARGIDAAAHRAALEWPPAQATVEPACVTVAVVAGGADVCSPAGHRVLRRRLLERGLVVSEFVWGTSARAWRFPARNRVMAALSHAVVVVEGASRSGALITARQARALERPLLAVPGECGRVLSQGPHGLLHDGATICDSAASVRRALEHAADGQRAPLDGVVGEWLARERRARRARPGGRSVVQAAGALSPAAKAVLAVLDETSVGVDALVVRSGLPAPIVLDVLGALELSGVVGQTGDGRYRSRRGVHEGGTRGA